MTSGNSGTSSPSPLGLPSLDPHHFSATLFIYSTTWLPNWAVIALCNLLCALQRERYMYLECTPDHLFPEMGSVVRCYPRGGKSDYPLGGRL